MFINHDPVMTLTNSKARSTQVTYYRKLLKQNIYDFEKEIDPRGYSDPCPEAIYIHVHVYEHYCRTNLLVYILDLR